MRVFLVLAAWLFGVSSAFAESTDLAPFEKKGVFDLGTFDKAESVLSGRLVELASGRKIHFKCEAAPCSVRVTPGDGALTLRKWKSTLDRKKEGEEKAERVSTFWDYWLSSDAGPSGERVGSVRSVSVAQGAKSFSFQARIAE